MKPLILALVLATPTITLAQHNVVHCNEISAHHTLCNDTIIVHRPEYNTWWQPVYRYPEDRYRRIVPYAVEQGTYFDDDEYRFYDEEDDYYD